MKNAPDVCKARERLTGDTGRRLGGLDGVESPKCLLGEISMSRIAVRCSTSLPTGERMRTFFKGEDCSGETAEEKECFLFLLGVRGNSSGKPS